MPKHLLVLFSQQALENSGLSVGQPQGDAASRELQSQITEGAAVENKKVQSPDKLAREKKRSYIKKPIQMPGKDTLSLPVSNTIANNFQLLYETWPAAPVNA